MADAAVGTAYSPLPSAAHSEPAPEAKRALAPVVLDPAAESWARPPMYGIAPEALVGHSAALVGQELFIWGGGDGKHGYRRKSWLHELFD